MRLTKRTEIIAETQEVVLVRRTGPDAVAWCARCGELTSMLTLDKAMALTSASSREIHRRLEAGEVHFTETTGGFVLMCMSSLLKSN